MEFNMLSIVKLFDLIMLTSEIISVALDPTICAPKICPFLPTNIFINPSVDPTATAFPLAIKNDLATLKSVPLSCLFICAHALVRDK